MSKADNTSEDEAKFRQQAEQDRGPIETTTGCADTKLCLGTGTIQGEVVGPNKIDPKHLDLVTSHPDAHSLTRHGGNITNEQLKTRALTGVAPDGHVKVKLDGKVILPPLSSAFHSDKLLVTADQAVRNSSAFARKVSELPAGETFITLKAADVGDLGVDLGRGFKRIGSSILRSDRQGPPLLMENLRSAQATFEFNSQTKLWETVTIFPAPL